MLKIYLVSCVSQKISNKAQAKDLYVSQWFKKVKKFVENSNAKWLILSAKYGLLEPNQIIEPYDTYLKNIPAMERKLWADKVIDDLKIVLSNEAGSDVEIVFLAGKNYREYLIPKLSNYNISIPLEGLGIGQQLRWLDHANK